MKKKYLKEMAQRWVKGMLLLSEPSLAFEDLTDDEVAYMEGIIRKIANSITDLDACQNSESMVREYSRRP